MGAAANAVAVVLVNVTDLVVQAGGAAI